MEFTDFVALYEKHPFLDRFLPKWRADTRKVRVETMDDHFLGRRMKEDATASPHNTSGTLKGRIYLLDASGSVLRRAGRFHWFFTRNRTVAEELLRLDQETRNRLKFAVALARRRLVLYKLPDSFSTFADWQRSRANPEPKKNRTTLRRVS